MACTQPGDRLDPQDLILEVGEGRSDLLADPVLQGHDLVRAQVEIPGTTDPHPGEHTRNRSIPPTCSAESALWILAELLVMSFKAARFFRIACSASRTW